MTNQEAPAQARTAVADFKKGLLREAAKEVFSKRGMMELGSGIALSPRRVPVHSAHFG